MEITTSIAKRDKNTLKQGDYSMSILGTEKNQYIYLLQKNENMCILKKNYIHNHIQVIFKYNATNRDRRHGVKICLLVWKQIEVMTLKFNPQIPC